MIHSLEQLLITYHYIHWDIYIVVVVDVDRLKAICVKADGA